MERGRGRRKRRAVTGLGFVVPSAGKAAGWWNEPQEKPDPGDSVSKERRGTATDWWNEDQAADSRGGRASHGS